MRIHPISPCKEIWPDRRQQRGESFKAWQRRLYEKPKQLKDRPRTNFYEKGKP